MTKRPSLTSFAPPGARPDGAVISQSTAREVPEDNGKKYPKVSVYLTAAEVRALKLLSVDAEKRVSDICAEAIRDWMSRHGHARTHNL